TKTKKQNTPAKLQHKTLMRKEFRKMAKSVKNQGCNGKKIMAVRIIKHTTEIIDLLTDGNSI
uniref:Ribosomal protein S7 domain-containing protein n=1 Tax=Aegilops tauschii subsp. strangulata TaxID=200361 RepID=A0A453GPJ3_AEGTS